jgi:hypothetical protein
VIASGVGQERARAHGANASFFFFFFFSFLFFLFFDFFGCAIFLPKQIFQIDKEPLAFVMLGGSISDESRYIGIESAAVYVGEDRWSRKGQDPASKLPKTVRGPNRAYNQR